jgi:predicted RNase H-like nuclease (RuvC/YqgF family)
MVEKHINRKDDDDEDAQRKETGINLESYDPMDVTARTIIFGKEISNAPKEIIIKEKSEQIKDQMNNTNQYLKFINAHLAVNKSKIDKIKEAKKRFEEEVESLQNTQLKPRDELDRVHYKYITESDAKSLLVHLESEREILREKLAHQQEQIEKTKQLLQQKDEHIFQIKNEIDIICKKNTSPNDDPIAVIKEELVKLGIKDDSAKILGALNSLSSLLDSKSSVNAHKQF